MSLHLFKQRSYHSDDNTSEGSSTSEDCTDIRKHINSDEDSYFDTYLIKDLPDEIQGYVLSLYPFRVIILLVSYKYDVPECLMYAWRFQILRYFGPAEQVYNNLYRHPLKNLSLKNILIDKNIEYLLKLFNIGNQTKDLYIEYITDQLYGEYKDNIDQYMINIKKYGLPISEIYEIENDEFF